VDAPIAVTELGAQPRCLGHLHPVLPDGFWFEAAAPGQSEGFSDDLPWWLHPLRPSGYLGRLVPARHPSLGLPPDIHVWSADHVLHYLTTAGWHGVGALVVGQEALAAAVLAAASPSPGVSLDQRQVHYLERAHDVLRGGPPGSSAVGEAPKFLARVGGRDVLVKFSPPLDGGAFARRRADLLLAEHHALQSLRDGGHPAARTEVVCGERVFLEVERFDRVAGHRRGQASLVSLDGEFVGRLTGWAEVVGRLVELGLASAADLRETRFLAQVGRWIGNTDMHLGNLSFHLDGTRPAGLAPAYDMLPMAYAPVGGEVVERRFEPTLDETDGRLAREALQVAGQVWRRIAEDRRVSPAFRSIARENRAKLEALRPAVDRLP